MSFIHNHSRTPPPLSFQRLSKSKASKSVIDENSRGKGETFVLSQWLCLFGLTSHKQITNYEKDQNLEEGISFPWV